MESFKNRLFLLMFLSSLNEPANFLAALVFYSSKLVFSFASGDP
jgi:hypothetical protein